jgi:hypothetical protein
MDHINKQRKPKSKRLRKKLYVDEYAILGFSLKCNLALKNKIQFDVFIDDFLVQAASQNLMVGGGGDAEYFEVFITSSKRYGSPSIEGIEVIESWLLKNKDVSNLSLGQLVDVNYSF